MERTGRHMTDEEFKDRAFAQYRQEKGIHESVRLGDLPLRSISEVLERAQRMKMEQQP
jgi:hypothetical protein